MLASSLASLLLASTIVLPAGATASERPVYLTLSDGVETVQAGEDLTYTVSLRNDAVDPVMTNITMTLPLFVNLLEASNGGVRNADTVTWNNVVVSPSATQRLYVKVVVNPYVENGATMTAQVVTSEGERAADVTHITGSSVLPLPSTLRLSVTDGKDFAAPEEELRYQLAVENVGPDARTFTLRADLPDTISFLGATGQYDHEGNVVRWLDQVIAPGDVRLFEIMAYVERETPDFSNITLKASVDGHPQSDLTVVQRGPVLRGFEVSLTDGQQEASPASELMYEIHLRNNDDVLATGLAVSAALPMYTEFVDAGNGGVWTGNNVRWSNMTVSPHGERVLTFTAHVRTDAPLDAELRATAEALGQVGVDLTTVVAGVVRKDARDSDVMLRKFADKSEVRPGDTVTYTIELRNTTDHPFRSVRIEDRLDTLYMKVLGAESGMMQGDQLVWFVDELAPGQIWRVRYSVEISPRAPHGSFLDNVVTVSGEGLETQSLNERVFTGKTGVVRKLPPTGAAYDAIFLLFAGIAGAGQTFAFRKRRNA